MKLFNNFITTIRLICFKKATTCPSDDFEEFNGNFAIGLVFRFSPDELWFFNDQILTEFYI